MKYLNNPFVTYGYKGAKYFCDRQSETQKIMSGLENERNITLIAPRRIGKTGLIHHVFAQIHEQQPDVKCFYIDIFTTKNLTQFVQLLANQVIGKLDSPTNAALRKVSEFFASFRPTMSFDAHSGLPTFSLDIAENQQEQTLQRIFEYMEKSGKRCYVAIDEFQQITEYPEKGTEALLRSYIQFIPNVYFIFAGSQQHLMSDMFLSAKRPFYQSSQIVMLGEIDEKVYYHFALNFFSKIKVDFPLEVFHYLYYKLEGQTWYLQVTLNRFYAKRPDDVTQQSIDITINELVGEQEAAFENYFSTLTENQCNLLVAIAYEGKVESPMANNFIKKYNLTAPSSVKTALTALIERQLVYSYHGNYIVYDRFFNIWLRTRTGKSYTT